MLGPKDSEQRLILVREREAPARASWLRRASLRGQGVARYRIGQFLPCLEARDLWPQEESSPAA